MENPEYKVLFYAVDENFGALWPDKWDTNALRARYREINDSVQFNRAFRNQVVDMESAMVRSTWLKYSHLADDKDFLAHSDDLLYLTSYDTADAPSGNKNQDYTAGCTIAVDLELRLVYVIDAWHDRLTTKDQSERVYHEWKHYKPFRVLIEKAGLGTLAEWVLEAHPEMRGVIEVVRPTLSKALRLMGVTPMMQGGQVIFSHHLNPDDEAWNPGRGSLPGELVDFPFGKHDDLVDCYVHSLRYAHDLMTQHSPAKVQDTVPKKKYRI
jgi:phage terminase large subunit-like protein